MADRVVLQRIEELASQIANMESGLLTHAFLSEHLGADRRIEKEKYYGRVTVLKHTLKNDHGKFLRRNRGVGYEIVPIGEEILITKGDYVRGVKKMANAVADTQKIILDRMSEEARQRTVMESQRMANTLLLVRKSFQVSKDSLALK